MASTDIVPASEYQIIKEGASLLPEIIKENIGSGGVSEFDLPRVKIPTGGGTAWEVPALEGTDAAKQLEGIVVAWSDPRAYWDKNFDESGGGTPPDCSSPDSDIGNGLYGPGSEVNPTGECIKCPMSQWGSDPRGGNGQACKQMRLVLVLQPESLLPLAIFLPPTSVKAMKNYFLSLTAKALSYYGVITRLELEQTKSETGITYSKVKPSFAGRVDAQQLDAVRAYSEQIRSALEKMQITSSDYATAQTE